jgi:hypothetical protein
MRNLNKNKEQNMGTLTDQGYKLIDNSNDCANYAKTNDNGTVTVETLYRYGKPVVKTYTKSEFIAWREDIKKTETNETKLYVPELVWNVIKADFEVKESI